MKALKRTIRLIVCLWIGCTPGLGCGPSSGLPTPGPAVIRAVDQMAMVPLPAGELWMGSQPEQVMAASSLCRQFWDNCAIERLADEQPRHRVKLDRFWIDRTEVSNRQYRGCVEAGACTAPACWAGPQFDDPEQPVVCVTWTQAGEYCAWAGGQLPTEAQWEYAARGSSGALYPWGESFDGARLNYCDATCGRPRADPEYDDGQLYSAPVGSYPQGASWCGALDMAGNVSEWTADWYAAYDPTAVQNPTGPATGASRVIRGGSWFLTRVEARTTWRGDNSPGSWFDDIGFRCLRPSPPEG